MVIRAWISRHGYPCMDIHAYPFQDIHVRISMRGYPCMDISAWIPMHAYLVSVPIPIPREERHTQAAALILRNICYYGYLTVSGTQLDGREAGLDLIIGVLEDVRKCAPRTSY